MDDTGLNYLCSCLWSPNDIAATLLSEERSAVTERIGKAVVDECPFKLLHYDYTCRCSTYADIVHRAGGAP
jgi:hypothetical protein